MDLLFVGGHRDVSFPFFLWVDFIIITQEQAYQKEAVACHTPLRNFCPKDHTCVLRVLTAPVHLRAGR